MDIEDYNREFYTKVFPMKARIGRPKRAKQPKRVTMAHRTKTRGPKRVTERHRELAKARPPRHAPGQEKI